jgi:hypothetical protein
VIADSTALRRVDTSNHFDTPILETTVGLPDSCMHKSTDNRETSVTRLNPGPNKNGAGRPRAVLLIQNQA